MVVFGRGGAYRQRALGPIAIHVQRLLDASSVAKIFAVTVHSTLIVVADDELKWEREHFGSPSASEIWSEDGLAVHRYPSVMA